MLASITPLGERVRGHRWGLTITLFVAASAVGGTAFGAAGGLIGSFIMRGPMAADTVRVGLLGAAAAVAFLVGVGVIAALPSIRRQVNASWLDRYRSGVYAIGFGFQLGFGVLTIVTTASIYLMLAAVVVAGEPTSGALIGLAFGLARGLTAIPARIVQERGDLLSLTRRLDAARAPVRALDIATQALVAAISGTLVIIL